MLGYIVCARAVELYQHVVDWVLQCALDVRADLGHRRREGAQWGRFVRRVTVYGVAVVVSGMCGFVGGWGRSLAVGIDLAFDCN